MTSPIIARLDGRATRFLGMMVDFGHVDVVSVDEIIAKVAPFADEDNIIRYETIKAFVASYLFAVNAGQVVGSVDDDWKLIFS